MLENKARTDAIEWAKRLLDMPADRWVILDTETTGLSGSDQVVQVAVIDGAGNVLIDNELIKPTCEMSFEAEMVHGISLDKLADAPTLKEVYPRLFGALFGKLVIIYNADIDVRMLNQTARAQIEQEFFATAPDKNMVQCAMIKYSEYVGEWNPKFHNFRWQRLPAGTHDALGDCRAVLGIIKMMAASNVSGA